MNIHATCVSVKGNGILILGKSGSGKSDLALRLISQFGAHLVADDRVDIKSFKNKLQASAPATIKGLLEVRGIGLVKMKSLSSVGLSLVVHLVENTPERLPEKEEFQIMGCSVPQIKINPFEISAAAKVIAALSLL